MTTDERRVPMTPQDRERIEQRLQGVSEEALKAIVGSVYPEWRGGPFAVEYQRMAARALAQRRQPR